jgi:hypothetical protein
MTTDCLSDRSWWLAVFLYEKLEVHCIYTPNDMECVKAKFVSFPIVTRLLSTRKRSASPGQTRIPVTWICCCHQFAQRHCKSGAGRMEVDEYIDIATAQTLGIV